MKPTVLIRGLVGGGGGRSSGNSCGDVPPGFPNPDPILDPKM